MAQNTTNTPIAEVATTQLHHARKGKAEKLDAILRAEYPALELFAVLDTDTDRVSAFVVSAESDEGTTEVLYEGEAVPELADLLEAAEDLGIDPEAGDSEETVSGSVVDEVYRQRYALASSTGQSCGDWLAEQLANDTLGKEGFRVADFQAILDHNGVDQSGRWARLPESYQKGWVGRWRMSGRQVLEKQVALSGVYLDPTGAKLLPEAGWLAAMQRKHEKWLAKQRKLEEALKQD
jgi:hypothetical protein